MGRARFTPRDSLVNTLNDFVQEVCPVSKPLKAESARLKGAELKSERED